MLVELAITVASLFLVINMTSSAMSSYQQAQDTAYGAIDEMQQKTNSMYGDSPTGYMPAQAQGILSNLMKFRM
jgi:hypothetical protein